MDAMPKFKKAVIIGVGLIGGSLAGILKARGLADTVVGVGRSRQNLEEAVGLGLIDSYSLSVSEAAGGADLVVLTCPVGMFESIAEEIKPHLAAGAIVTDAGSVKGSMVYRLEEMLAPISFVGAHPIAGSDRSGACAADIKIFEGARCILTPTKKTAATALSAIQAIWETAGSRVVHMEPFVHDSVFAKVSHLPHIAAFGLVSAVAGMEGGLDAMEYAAGGFRDTTRIAASHPDMWRDICLHNPESIVEALSAYIAKLEELKGMIENGDGDTLAEEFGKAQEIRKGMN